MLVSERYSNLRWAEKRHGRYLGRPEIWIEQQGASTSQGPQESCQLGCRLVRRRLSGWAPSRFVSFILNGYLRSLV